MDAVTHAQVTNVHKFSALDELELWWVTQGELSHDLAMYYAICSVVGLIQGLAIGRLIVRCL